MGQEKCMVVPQLHKMLALVRRLLLGCRAAQSPLLKGLSPCRGCGLQVWDCEYCIASKTNAPQKETVPLGEYHSEIFYFGRLILFII